MTTKRIIWTDENGNVRRFTPASQVVKKLISSGLTEDEAIEKLRVRHFSVHGYAPGTNHVIIEEKDLPYHGSFGRFAWRQDGATVPMFNMSRGRSIKTDQIRLERDERLKVEDINYIRADESEDIAEKQHIAIKKQKLRDLPAIIQPALNAISTPEALEAYEPNWP